MTNKCRWMKLQGIYKHWDSNSYYTTDIIELKYIEHQLIWKNPTHTVQKSSANFLFIDPNHVHGVSFAKRAKGRISVIIKMQVNGSLFCTSMSAFYFYGLSWIQN